jgi:hypothetical protein
MKDIIVLIGILAIPMSANAAMFKCTDADGRVSFSDKPCPEQQQETLKERAVSKPPETSPETGDAATTETEPIETATGAQLVTNDSPLAVVYMNFLAALKKCDRGEMLKYGSVKIAKDLARMSDTDLKNQCAQLKNFMPNDFTGATEVIDGNKGSIQWRNEASSSDESGPSTMKSMYTVNFIQEDGAWKYGD